MHVSTTSDGSFSSKLQVRCMPSTHPPSQRLICLHLPLCVCVCVCPSLCRCLCPQPSDIRWASRWDTYLKMTDDQIHWFSIVNSVMIVLFLSGMVAMIMVRPRG